MKAASSPSRSLKPPVRWLKAYWDEQDVWYYFEVDEDGWASRQVELRGPARIPTTAASLAEWPDATIDGIDAVRSYESKYGGTAEAPIGDFDDTFAPTEIDRSEFDELWTRARSHLEGR
jgi:hypothetical protein